MKLRSYNTKQEAFAVAKASWLGLRFVNQIFAHQNLHQLVPIDLTDHAPGTTIVGDIGGVLGEQIADDLIDGVVAFFVQGVEHTTEYGAHIVFVVAGHCEF